MLQLLLLLLQVIFVFPLFQIHYIHTTAYSFSWCQVKHALNVTDSRIPKNDNGIVNKEKNFVPCLGLP